MLPYINAAAEIKTKPTQHSVMRLREIGIEPDILVCRTENDAHLTDKLKVKLGLFCNVEQSHVFESPDVETIYEIPLVLYKQNFDKIIVLPDVSSDGDTNKYETRFSSDEGSKMPSESPGPKLPLFGSSNNDQT